MLKKRLEKKLEEFFPGENQMLSKKRLDKKNPPVLVEIFYKRFFFNILKVVSLVFYNTFQFDMSYF